MNPIRILFLNTTFKNEGPTHAILPLLRGLDRERFLPLSACMHQGGPFEGTLDRLGIPHRNFDLDHPLSLGGLQRLHRFLADERIDLVHAQLLRAELAASLATWPGRIPYIAHVHSTDDYRDSLRRPVRFLASRLSVGRADAVIAVSEAVRRFVIAHQGVPPERIFTLHNAVAPRDGAPTESRLALRARLGLGGFELVGLFTGRLVKPKGVDVLLAALAGLPPEASQRLGFVFLGDGPERGRLEALAGSLGLAAQVRWLGFVYDVATHLAAADLFVLPSLVEGLPMAILEAMAAGLPVIGTRVSGVPELVAEEETGLLVPPRDVPALTAALRRLISDAPLRGSMGERGARRAREEFSPARMTARYEEIVGHVLQRRSPA